MSCSATAVIHLLLLKEADLIQIERSRVFISEVPELPVVDDLDFGLVRATGDAFDETRTVGWDVDAGGVVDLLYHRVSLLATTARSALALPRYFGDPTRLHLILIDGVFGLRVFLCLIAF